MRNKENPLDFTPTFSVGGCTRAYALPYITTVCPFYTLEEPDAAGCVATVIRPRGSGHGLTRSRGVTRGLARDVTWHCVRLHPIRLNRAFRSDLMWWRTFVEDWNGIRSSPLPPICRWLGGGAWHGCNWFQLQWDERSADLPKVRTYLGVAVLLLPANMS